MKQKPFRPDEKLTKDEFIALAKGSYMAKILGGNTQELTTKALLKISMQHFTIIDAVKMFKKAELEMNKQFAKMGV